MTASNTQRPPIDREAARVILLDPEDRVLLIHERITGGTHWLTPGGGRETGETLTQAAVRELYEETSLQVELAPTAAEVHVVRRQWHWDDATYNQTDHYFVVTLDHRPAVVPAELTSQEEETLLGFHWWSVDELRQTTDVIEPVDLADLLGRLRPAARRGA